MTVKSLFETLTPHEQRAVRLLKAMLDSHNTRDGVGLFTGISRYAVLEERCRLTAIRCRTVRQWWSLASRTLKLPMTPTRLDGLILSLLDGDDDDAVLSALSDQTSALVMIARALHTEDKDARKALAAESRDALNEPIENKVHPELNDELPL